MNEMNPRADIPEPEADIDSPRLIPYEIPVEGSLGLLAVGYRGLLAWREKRAAAGQDNMTEQTDE